MALQAHNLCGVDKEGSGQEAIRSKEGAGRRRSGVRREGWAGDNKENYHVSSALG